MGGVYKHVVDGKGWEAFPQTKIPMQLAKNIN